MSVFSRIIAGELPARFVWRDEVCVAFLSTGPLKPGHVLVVPREEVPHWIELDAGTWTHISEVARQIGQAIDRAYHPEKVGLVLVGLEVPHVHIHVSPIWSSEDLNFANAATNPTDESMDAAAQTLRDALRELGAAHVAD